MMNTVKLNNSGPIKVHGLPEGGGGTSRETICYTIVSGEATCNKTLDEISQLIKFDEETGHFESSADVWIYKPGEAIVIAPTKIMKDGSGYWFYASEVSVENDGLHGYSHVLSHDADYTGEEEITYSYYVYPEGPQ